MSGKDLLLSWAWPVVALTNIIQEALYNPDFNADDDEHLADLVMQCHLCAEREHRSKSGDYTSPDKAQIKALRLTVLGQIALHRDAIRQVLQTTTEHRDPEPETPGDQAAQTGWKPPKGT